MERSHHRNLGLFYYLRNERVAFDLFLPSLQTHHHFRIDFTAQCLLRLKQCTHHLAKGGLADHHHVHIAVGGIGGAGHRAKHEGQLNLACQGGRSSGYTGCSVLALNWLWLPTRCKCNRPTAVKASSSFFKVPAEVQKIKGQPLKRSSFAPNEVSFLF